MVEGSARHIMLHAQHLGARITGSGGGGRVRVSAAGNQRGRRHGNAGIGGHGNGRGSAANLFLLHGGVDAHLARRVDWGIGVRRRMRSGPGICELRRIVMRQRTMVINTVEAHPAVLAVLVLNDHRHGDSSMGV